MSYIATNFQIRCSVPECFKMYINSLHHRPLRTDLNFNVNDKTFV